MNWTLVIVVVIVVGLFALKGMSVVAADVAAKHLLQGALVIDVRSPEEFLSGHVPGAINIPLGQLQERIPHEVRDKNQPLLVHCLSGGRSAIARQQLKGMGYTIVSNLGSLSRAKQIVKATRRD